MKRPAATILFAVSLFLSIAVRAQADSTQLKKIDSLFSAWNAPNHPGGAVGVMKDGKTIFSRAYGLASLEYLAPNSTGTVFNTGSVSKQFTAMGIVRLEDQGKLSFDDEIHAFIPDFPDFEHPITIRHLLHHTSGLRSLHALFALGGWRGDDSRTNADLNRIILKQRDLNFQPGAEYLYCNTGYMLMVNIIEKVTGEGFTDWIRKNIFEELGMNHTYVEDVYSRVVPNNATSYYGRNEFERAVEYWGYVGSGNMHSTTADLLKWLSNFENPKEGWESSFRKLQTLDPLNDGTPNNYAFGVVVDQHLGKNRIQHGGAIGGFRAFIAAYPEQRVHIAVLTNFSAGNPGGKANQIAGILFGGVPENGDHPEPTTTFPMAAEELTRFEGAFWNETQKYFRKIYLKNDTLRYWRSEDNESPLLPQGKNSFAMLGVGGGLTVSFEGVGENRNMVVASGDEAPETFGQVKITEATTAEQGQYSGAYYSPEVETTYTVSAEEDQLQMYHSRHGVIPLKRLFRDVYSGEWPIGTAEFQRDGEGRISGVLISNGRVRNAWFGRDQDSR